MFVSYLSTNIFSLAILSIPTFINAILSATAIQKIYIYILVSKCRVVHANIHMCGCHINSKEKLVPGNLQI